MRQSRGFALTAERRLATGVLRTALPATTEEV